MPLPPQVFLRRRLLPSQQSSLQHTGADPERRESHRSRRLPLRALEVHVERVPHAHDAGVRVGQLGSGLSRRAAEHSRRFVPVETSDADCPSRLHAPRVHDPEQREVQLVAVVDAHGAGVHAARVDDGHHPPHALLRGSDCVTGAPVLVDLIVTGGIVVALLAPVVALAVPRDAVRAREHVRAPRSASHARSARHDVHARSHRASQQRLARVRITAAALFADGTALGALLESALDLLRAAPRRRAEPVRFHGPHERRVLPSPGLEFPREI